MKTGTQIRYLAWLSLTFLERLPGAFLQPLPVEFGRYRYPSGFVARRSAEELAPFRRFEAILRDTWRPRRGSNATQPQDAAHRRERTGLESFRIGRPEIHNQR